MFPSSDPFSSPAVLQQGFADGLASLLDTHSGLGVYILVLANAACDSDLWAQLSPALSARHAELADSLAQNLRRGDRLAEPEDDVLVFLKLVMIGFEHLGRMERRRAGPWDVLFNPIRALRPPRSSELKFDALLRPFEPAGFNFNKPFLAREILWQGELDGKPARLLYNKFPFARLHGLLVAEPQRNMPQYLGADLHSWAWKLTTQSGVPGLCLGYNSHGGGASVNHLHFQSFVQSKPLPIQDPGFIHNGGILPYPLPCRRFSDPAETWLELERLHQQNTPYNLVYHREGLHLVARVPQDDERLSAQCRGYGWSEMAGAVTLFSRKAYEELDAAGFENELASFAPAA